MKIEDKNVKRLGADFLLLVATFFWGITFVVVKDAIDKVGVFFFLTQRFAFAFMVLLPICLAMRPSLTLKCLKHGLILGTLLFGAYTFQTLALVYTTASNTAFLTGVNVIMVPLFGAIIFQHAISRNMYAGVILAGIGIYLLSTNGTCHFNGGDLLGILCAVCVALHIILTGRYSLKNDIYWLTTIQFAVITVASGVIATLGGANILEWHEEIMWPLIICVLFASIFAFLIQTSMQRFASPTHTALIFCMEPVFGALCAYWVIGEKFGSMGLVGAGFILSGMILSEMPPNPQLKAFVRRNKLKNLIGSNR
ncbi:MAG: EamA family transporter [Desulfobacteraceae bacterium 4484_190.3]|nr:MAG: EamA family transporter [Desulfobacteraceae bacterium 4484_190.3]